MDKYILANMCVFSVWHLQSFQSAKVISTSAILSVVTRKGIVRPVGWRYMWVSVTVQGRGKRGNNAIMKIFT